MKIGNDYFRQEVLYGKKNDSNTVNSFSDAIHKANDKFSARDTYINSTNFSTPGICATHSISQDIELPIETDRYKIEDATYVNGIPAYEIKDKLTGKGLYIREDQLVIQKDEKTGMEFLMDMEQPLLCNVTMTDELKILLNNSSEKRNIDLKEIPLQGGLVVNYDSRTGLNYLSIRGNEAKGVSVILTSEKDIEKLNKLVDEFQQYEVSSRREIAGLYAMLEISGNLKREKEGFIILTPEGITYIPYNGDSGKIWEIEMPAAYYPIARKYMATGNNCGDLNKWTHMLQGIKIYYGDSKKIHSYKIDDSGRFCMFG